MSNPNNIINQNLAIGGNLAVAGNMALTGDAVVVGDVLATGRIGSGEAIGVITPTFGSFSLDFTEVLFNVDTTSATTAITLPAGSLPFGAAVVGVTMRVTTAISGVGFDSNDGVLTLNPGVGNVIIGSLGGVPYTVGTTDARIPGSFDGALPPNPPPIFPVLINVPDSAELTFSGGATSDVPNLGGTVRLTIYFFRVAPPNS